MGVCSFIQKANRADLAEAVGVLVINDPQNGDAWNIIPVSNSFFDKEKTPVLLINFDIGETLMK
jgi:hypothetical protein